MERKTMMGLAAVAGAVALLYMRSRSASAEAGSTGGVLTSNASWLNSAMGNASSGWGANPVTITVNQTKPLAVDDVAKSPAPAPAPVAPVPTFGGGGDGSVGVNGMVLDGMGGWRPVTAADTAVSANPTAGLDQKILGYLGYAG